MNRKRLFTWLVVSLVVVFVFWNPMTRAAFLFLLPLGSGLDDIVFWVAAVVAAVLLVIYNASGIKIVRKDDDE